MNIPDDILLVVARACCCAGECDKDTCIPGLKSHHWISKAKAAIDAVAPFIIAEAVKAERERCANIVMDFSIFEHREVFAEAIRSGK